MGHDFKKNENCYRKLVRLSVGPVNQVTWENPTEIPLRKKVRIIE